MNEGKKFQRKIEDFICEKCGKVNFGNGYTNHCSHCLWSKHIDKNPGDRAEKCQGMMKPIRVFFRSQHWFVEHRCQKCQKTTRVKTSENDNQEMIKNILNQEIRGGW